MKLKIEIDDVYIPVLAKEMGYREFMETGTGEIVQNTQSREDYIEFALSNLLVGMSFKKQIEQEANDFAVTRKVALEDEIKTKVKVKKDRVE